MTTIIVAQRHLTQGIPGNPCTCPVALAVIDAYPHAWDVTIGDQYISMHHQALFRLLTIPAGVRALVTAIDRGEFVKPFSFELDYPAVTP